eukprot:SAG31_NODE_4864_length_2900_cov_1.249554_3_plen_43_part_00
MRSAVWGGWGGRTRSRAGGRVEWSYVTGYEEYRYLLDYLKYL